MVGSESDLIKEICDISRYAISCAHHKTSDSAPFIDWYILLQVEDNAGVDIIRKKYHRYALLLHPDKNKHPKAEIAFKLISEGYACLSDNARRSEFDVKRWNNHCNECAKMRTKVKCSSPSTSSRSRSKKISARVKEVKARMMEEARVMEKCLKANASANVDVFDPGNYASSQGYPHFGVGRCNEPKSSTWLKKRFKYETQQQQQQQSDAKCDSPVFECKASLKFKPVAAQI